MIRFRPKAVLHQRRGKSSIAAVRVDADASLQIASCNRLRLCPGPCQLTPAIAVRSLQHTSRSLGRGPLVAKALVAEVEHHAPNKIRREPTPVLATKVRDPRIGLCPPTVRSELFAGPDSVSCQGPMDCDEPDSPACLDLLAPLRHVAGGTPNCRLNARLNAASDS